MPNSVCSKIAVANEGEGKYASSTGLTDPEGSVDILSVTVSGSTVTLTKASVALGSYTDDQLISMGVHLPLPLKAMEFWDDNSSVASSLNFASARASYSPNMNLEPEYLAWSADDTKLYVNLQENN